MTSPKHSDSVPGAQPETPASGLFESRFAQIPAHAIDDQELTHVDLRVLGVIAYHSSRDRGAWPKQKTIADRLGIARETVNRSIKRLREKGLVQVEEQYRADGGQRESLYTVLYDVPRRPLSVVSGDGSETQAAPGPVTPDVTGARDANDHGGRDASRHTSKDEQTIGTYPPIPPNGGDEIETGETAFAKIWALWPEQGRKHSPGAAMCQRAMEKHGEGIPLASLIAAVAAFVKSADPRYAPSLSKWFRERKFEAWLPKHAPASNAGGASTFSTDLPPPPTEKAAKCLAALRSRYGHTSVAAWFRDAIWDGDLIRVPTTFQRDRIEATFGGVLYEHGFQAVEGSAAA